MPGVGIVATPRGSILHATRASQLPYNPKQQKCVFGIFTDFLYFPYIPFKGVPIVLSTGRYKSSAASSEGLQHRSGPPAEIKEK